MKQKLMGIAEAVLLALVILAGAIAIPVLCRPFFYLHIAPLNLAEEVGLTVGQVKTAYNEMMDYCIGLTDTFSVGALRFSPSGAAHFADVRRLFALNLRVLAVAAVLLIAVKLLQRRARVKLVGHTPGFWSAVGLGVTFSVVGVLAALDFERAFTVFHRLFFPGKTNWEFIPWQDPVIRILPQAFFRNCAILILLILLISCGLLLAWDRKVCKK